MPVSRHPKIMKRITQIFYLLILSGCLVTGTLGLGFGLLPYPLLKQAGNKLAKDGNLESFTPAAYNHLHLGILVIGILLLLAGTFCIIRPKAAKNIIVLILVTCGKILSRLISDTKELLKGVLAVRMTRWEWFAIIGLTILAVLLRLPWMNRPLEYDEAYTFNELARHSLRQIISDYSLPNNHIFHTILVHFSFLLFGNQAWAIRLPVLISSLFLIPGVYLLARRWFNRTSAFLSAGLVTIFPYLILKSATARGYMLIALFTLISLLLGEYLATRKNYPGWILWSLCIALGFYTNPSMIYPFAAIFAWLILKTVSIVPGSGYKSRREWIIFNLVFSLLAGILTIGFYLPVLWSKGFVFFFSGARTVESLPFSLFVSSFPDVMKILIREWEYQIPGWTAFIFASGLLLILITSLRDRRGGALLLAALPTGVGAVLLVQRPDSIPRIWLWALPLILILASAGFTNILEWIKRAARLPRSTTAAILSGILLVFSINTIVLNIQQVRVIAANSDEMNVTLYLKPKVTPEDIVIVSSHADAVYWYYFTYYHLPEVSIRNIKDRPFNRAFVVVYPGNGETFQQVLTQRGPDYGFPDLNAGKLLTTIGAVEVYKIEPDPGVMERLFGQSP
jgi:hypothetical protein